MSGDMMLAVVLAALGVFDIAFARALAAKHPGSAPRLLQIAGIMMLGVAALLAVGVIRIVG
jgi:hypothetical protein